MIKEIESAGFTYIIDGDGVYFDTKKFSEYGVLAGRSKSDGYERITVNRYKHSPNDFALWKFSKKNESRQQEWDSPFGIGYPGWHIECSTMARELLGQEIDIHTGGIDHIPIHHTNEIAQSESISKKQFVKYWVHSAFLKVNNERVAKSKGNSILLSDLIKKDIHPLALRYLFLTVHYRKEMNFTDESLDAASVAYEKIASLCSLNKPGKPIKEVVEKVNVAMRDNLDSPAALASIWKMIREEKESKSNIVATIKSLEYILGIDFISNKKEVPKEIKDLIIKREKAREGQNWAEADKIRNKIESMGFQIKDTDKGTEVI